MSESIEIYRKLLLLFGRSKRIMFELVEKFGMTPVQGMLLMHFEPGVGKSMQKLSSLMGCDASNITGLVDRLDSQKLIERTVDPNDRRVKLIQLSQQGIICRNEILLGLSKAEAIDLHKLTPADQKELEKLIDKLIR